MLGWCRPGIINGSQSSEVFVFIGVIVRLVVSFVKSRKQNQGGQGQGGQPPGEQFQGGKASYGPNQVVPNQDAQNQCGQGQYDQSPMVIRRARRRMR